MDLPLNEDGSVKVTNLNQIKFIVKQYLPGSESKPEKITTHLQDGDKKYEVSATVAGGDKRSVLMDGFNIIKKRTEILEKIPEGTNSPITLEGRMWLDNIIERDMGGTRDGLTIRWDLQNATYKFDPFTGKLTCLV